VDKITIGCGATKTVEWHKYEEDREFDRFISKSAIKGPCTSRAFDGWLMIFVFLSTLSHFVSGVLLPPGLSCSSHSQAGFSSLIIDTTLPSSLTVSYLFGLQAFSSFLGEPSSSQGLKTSSPQVSESQILSLSASNSKPFLWAMFARLSLPCGHWFPLAAGRRHNGTAGGHRVVWISDGRSSVTYYSHRARM
jgi:hypothetical protein